MQTPTRFQHLGAGLAVFVSLFLVNASPARAEPPSNPFAAPYAGTALDDIEDPMAARVLAWLKEPEIAESLELGAVFSFSFARISHNPAGTLLDVDVMARHPRHVDAYPKANEAWLGQGRRPRYHGHGGLGLSRFRVQVPLDADTHPLSVMLLSRHELRDMDLQIRMSIGDTVVALEDRKTGFRRLWPLGVGALDFIRIPGSISSLTPTTEYGRLDKRNSWEIMTFPKNFMNLPYMPLHIPYLRRKTPPNEPPTYVYRPTWIAFHIWQPRRFARGFLSHGCMRMRDPDLLELAAFVWGVDDWIPVAIRAEPMPDMQHPHWKLTDRYWKLKNIGTEKAPKYWIMNGVWVTDYAAKAVVPQPEEIVGITIDPPEIVKLFDPGNPPTVKPGAWPVAPSEAAPEPAPHPDAAVPGLHDSGSDE